jgi:hypothetical protein
MTEPRSGAPESLPRGDDDIDEPDAEPIEDDDATQGFLTAEAEGEADTAESVPAIETEVERDRGVVAPVPGRRDRTREGRADRRRAPAPLTPSEQAVHIDDRISKLFVAAAVLVFVLIFLNAMLLGRGGTLSPAPTPRPTPAPTTSATATPSASASASASTSAPASASASASATASASPTSTATPTATP